MNNKIDPKIIEDRKRDIAERRLEFLKQRLNSEASLVYIRRRHMVTNVLK